MRTPSGVGQTGRDRSGEPTSDGWSWLFVHPLFWVSVVALVLNDHVFKAAFPGLVTGKLSDFAGVVMVALVLVAVTRWIWWSLAAVAAAFTVLKSLPEAAGWAAPVLGGPTLTDRSDLIALAALIPLGWWLQRCDGGTGRQIVARADRPLTTAIKIGGIVAAALATSATSCLPDAAFERLTLTSDGSIVASTASGLVPNRLTLPGATAPAIIDPADPPADERLDRDAWEPFDSEVTVGPARDQACTADRTCAEIRGLSIVEIDPTGTERVILDLTDQRRAINSQAGKTCQRPLDDRLPDVISDGEVIVVALGPVGALVRTSQGQWWETGSDGVYPSNARSADGARRNGLIARALPLIALLIGLGFLASRRARPLCWAIAVPLCGLVLIYTYSWTLFSGLSLSLAIIMSLIVIGICVGTWLLTRRRRPPSRQHGEHGDGLVLTRDPPDRRRR